MKHQNTPPSNIPFSQQSTRAADPSQAATLGVFALAMGQALTLHAHTHSVLRAQHGGLWLTSSRKVGGREDDVFLQAGACYTAQAGEVLVIEAWQRVAPSSAVASSTWFAWDALPCAATQRSAGAEWQLAWTHLKTALQLLAWAARHALRGLLRAPLVALAFLVTTVFIVSSASSTTFFGGFLSKLLGLRAGLAARASKAA